MSVSAPPSDDPSREQRCPRCGGVARVRRRRPVSMNPFLSKKEPTEVTCDDCGLDFEPPGAVSEVSSSKRGPWSRP